MIWVVLHHITSKAQLTDGNGVGFLLHITTTPSRYAGGFKTAHNK